MEPKRIYRSRNDKILAGICGGLGHYLNIDPVFIRILFIILLLTVGSGILIYLLAWILIPLEPEDIESFPKDTSSDT
jgi:phage shock protein C